MAIQVRNRVLAAARAEKWDLLDQVKQQPAADVMIEEIVAVYRAWAHREGLRQRTADDCVSALSYVLRRAGVKFERLDGVSSVVLTRETAKKFHDAMLSDDPSDRGRRTAKSYLLQAKSLFSARVIPEYERLKLRDVAGFARYAIKAPKNVYEYPSDLAGPTIKAGRVLMDVEPDLYAAFVLCYDWALRAGEAANARWDWCGTDANGAPCITIMSRADFKVKSKRPRTIPMDQQTWAELLRLKREDDPFILPGGSPSNREDLIKRRLAAWMRGLGWGRDRFPKAAHELRKLMGSEWYTKLGAEVAQTWLGHKSVQTTCDFYATLARQPRPLARVPAAG